MAIFKFVVDDQVVGAAAIPDAQVPRIFAAYVTLPGYDKVPTGEPAPVDPETGKETGPIPTRQPTPAEMWQLIAAGFIKGVLDNVKRIETEEDAKATPKREPIAFAPVAG